MYYNIIKFVLFAIGCIWTLYHPHIFLPASLQVIVVLYYTCEQKYTNVVVVVQKNDLMSAHVCIVIFPLNTAVHRHAAGAQIPNEKRKYRRGFCYSIWMHDPNYTHNVCICEQYLSNATFYNAYIFSLCHNWKYTLVSGGCIWKQIVLLLPAYQNGDNFVRFRWQRHNTVTRVPRALYSSRGNSWKLRFENIAVALVQQKLCR